MKRTILSALFLILSMNSFAQTTLDLEEIYNSKLLQKGTKIGKCEVFAIAASRTYGSGPVDLLEVGLQRADKTVVAKIFQDYLKISPNSKNNGQIIRSYSAYADGGIFGFGERVKSHEVKLEIKEITPSKLTVVDFLVESKLENRFGNMKLVKDNSINCK